MPLLGEHAHELLHPAAPASATGSARRGPTPPGRPASSVDEVTRPTSGWSSARPTPRPGLDLVAELEALPGGAAAGPAHRSPTPAPGSYHLAALDVVLPGGRRPRRAARLHRAPRGRAHPAAARGHRRAVAARGPRAAGPGSARATLAVLGTAGFDTRTGDGPRRARGLERQRSFRGRALRRPRRDPRRRRAAAAGRGGARAGRRRTPRRGSSSARPTTASTGSRRRSTPTSARGPRTRRTSRWCSTCGRPCGSTTTSPGCGRSPTARPASGIERFVLDDGWFHGRRDDTAGLGDWWVDHDVWPRGPDADRRARARPRHAVRAVVRARDGQPRLRPLPRPPRLDPGDGRAACRSCTAASWSSTCPGPRCGSTSTTTSTRCCRRRRSTTSSGTTTASCSTPAPPSAAGRPRCATRPTPSTGCSTRCASCTPTSTGSPAPPAAAGSTSACSSARSGCGPPT